MVNPITVQAFLVELDCLEDALKEMIYAIDRLPYDDDKVQILNARCADMVMNLPHIKTHVRENAE